MADGAVELNVSEEVLRRCDRVLKEALGSRSAEVETGGLMLGTFDGRSIEVQELLVDVAAQSSPSRIQLSARVFDDSRAWLEQRSVRSGQVSAIVGTWHTHPPGVNSYSSVDESTLFRDKMRLDTDDPSLAVSPWAHLIFPGFAVTRRDALCFSMQIAADYRLEDAGSAEEAKLLEACERLLGTGASLGVVIDGPGGIDVIRYHPDSFESHTVLGLWRHFELSSVSLDFEKVFLENFFRKTRASPFLYARSGPERRFRRRAFELARVTRPDHPRGDEAVRFVRIKPTFR